MKGRHILLKKLVLLCACVGFASLAAIDLLAYIVLQRNMVETVGRNLERVALRYARLLDGRRLADLASGEKGGEEYRSEVKAVLEHIRKQNGILSDRTLVLGKDGQGLPALIEAAGKERETLEPHEEAASAVLTVGGSYFTTIYQAADRRWISAYAAVRDTDGRIVGLLGIDHDMGSSISGFHKKYVLLFAATLLLYGLFLVTVFLYVRNQLHPLYEIVDAVGELREGNFTAPVAVHHPDEIGRLAGEFLELRSAVHLHLETVEKALKERGRELTRAYRLLETAERRLRSLETEGGPGGGPGAEEEEETGKAPPRAEWKTEGDWLFY